MLRRNARLVLPPRAHGGEDPEPGQRQADVADLLPVEMEAHLDQDQQQHADPPLREQPVDRDVDERLGPVLQLRRQGQEQHLARRLVEGVAERGVDDPAEGRRPDRVVEQHDQRARAQADRQHQQREPDPEQAVDAARQRDLDEEPDHRDVEDDTSRKPVSASGSIGPQELGRRHVELLLEDARPEGREPDDERDHLEVPGLLEEADGLRPATPFFLARCGHAREPGPLRPPQHRPRR